MKSFHTIERRFSFLLLTFLYFTFSSAWSKMPIENKYKPLVFTSSYVDLSLTATLSTQIAAIGDQVTFTLKVTNEAQTVASNVVVKDYLPANITINNISSTAGTFAQTTNEITWNIGNIASNTNEVTLTIIATLNTSGGYYNRAEIFGVIEPDLDSTPNNNNILEDDIAASCATIPYKYCNGEVIQISLTAPTGYSNYQWFKNNQPIANATQESYTITEIGSYTFKVGSVQIGTNCQASSCCPIIVERYNSLIITPSITDVSCFGGNNGNILVNTSGSTEVLQYSLNNGAFQSNNTFSNLIAGNNYLITVKDANGCLATSSLTITEPSKLTASGSAGTILCNGDKTTITASGNGGTGTYTYSINGTVFQSGATFTNIGAGTYTITVKDANGCLATSSLIITEPSKLVASGSAGTILCNGDKTTITASGNGGTGTYTYSINGTVFQSGASFTNIGSGTYTITVKDANGCLATSSLVITEPSKLVAIGSAGTILCNGEKTTITASGNGGTGIYTYSINGTVFQNGASFTNIGAGTYTITVKDANGCLVTSSLIITEPSKLVASSSAGTILCNGDKTTITAIGNGGTGTYTYSINGTVFQSGASFTNIGAGTYTITVKDANGCLATSSLVITEPSKLVASGSAGTILCNGDKTAITASGNGGTGTYTYSINGTVFQNGASFTNIGAGTYTITVKDANGCLATSSLTITEPSKLVASGSAGTILCNGDKTTITASGNGGTGIYTYSINGTIFQSGASFTNIGSGTYTITVKDANGCLATSSLTITEPSKLVASGSAGTILCNGKKTTITASGNGGTGIYTYSINGTVFQNGASFTNIGAGTYTITVKDANGCLVTSSLIITEPSKLVASSSAGTILCNGDKTTITASGNGSTGTYSYSINGTVFQSGASFTNIGSGTYTITVKDANGCLSTSSLTITEPSKFTASGSAGTILCNGDKTTITASGNGGTGIYTYSINGTVFQSGASFTNIGAGTYTITVKDANGCLATSSVVITEPSKLTASASAGTILCNGDKTTITASGNGGTGTYTYSINGTVFQSGASFTNIGAGTYTITVKDVNGCLSTSSLTITEPSKLVASVSAGTILCNGDKTTITASGNGGTGTYTYSINGTVFQSGASFTNIGAGTYTITVKDANGCLSTSSLTITEPSKLVASVSAGTILCNGDKMTITASGNGGTGIYTYSINGTVFQSGVSFTNIGSGTYTITVKDANGCLATSSLTITEPSKFFPIISSNTPICSGESILLSTSTGVSFVWTGPNNFSSTLQNPVIPSATIDYEGIYSVVVSNSLGCVGSATTIVTIKQLDKLISSNVNICEGQNLTLTSPDYGNGAVYQWNGPNNFTQIGRIVTINNITTLLEGLYTIIVEKNGCSVSATVSVDVKQKPVPPVITADKVLCSGNTVTLYASSCLGENIIWSNGLTGTSISVSSIGTYSAVCKVEECSSNNSNTIVLTNGTSPTAPLISSDKLICCDGASAKLTASGCTGVLSWNTGVTSSSIMVSTSGSYTAICSNNCGSSSSSNVIVIRTGTSPTAPVISSNKTSLCNTETAILSATSCNGTLKWSTNSTGTSITVSSAGTYSAVCENICGVSGASNIITISTGVAPIAPVISSDKLICCDGASAKLTASGCNGVLSWSTGVTASSINVSTSGSYTAICSNNCGSSSSSNIIVIRTGTSPAVPVISSNKTSLCGTESATLTASGCNGSVKWSTNATGTSITVSTAGTYSAVCENICGVSGASNVIIINAGTSPTAPVISSNKTSLCNTETAILTATGCNGSVKWSTNATGTSITVSSAGTYSAVCENICGVSGASNIITISTGVAPTAPIISSDKLICCDGASAKLTASGCTGVLSWSTGVTASSINVSTSGSYTAICSNNCGSSSSSNAIVIRTGTSPTAPVISSNKTSLCNTETATLTATGCTSTVKWSTNATGTSITVSSAGTYSAVCENICGVSGASNVITISTGVAPTAPLISSDKLICCDGASAKLTASGCTGVLSWSTGVTASSIMVSTSGSYTAICSNNCGSSSSSNVIVIRTGTSPTAPVISSNKTSLCSSETATLSAIGCNGTLKWSTNSTGTSITVSSAGTYSAVCENICGVSGASNVITISTGVAPTAPLISSDKLICCDGASAKLTASGCTGVLSWSTGVTASSIMVSTSGSYTAICSNNCGSSSSSNVIVIRTGTSPTAPVISSNKTSLCNTETAILTATGCNGSVKWSTNATGTSITVSNAGTYSAVCENICGVSGASNIIIINTGSSPVAPIISANKTSICNTETATLTVSGCNGSVKWSTNAIGTTITVSNAGTYTAKCTGVGCGESGASNQIIITTGYAPVSPIISAIKVELCGTESAILTASGCNGTIKWSTGPTTNIISVSVAGTFTSICKNSCGESGNSNALIIKKTDLPVAPGVSANSTNICGTERANLVANGCAGIVTWSTGATGTVLFVSAAGTYTATCSNICGESSVSQGVVIRQGNSPAAPIISSNKMSICSSEKATLISLGCSGTIIWSTGATGSSIQVSAGTYTATCVNACGVSGSSNVVNITNGGTPTPPTINASKTSICGTESVSLTASNCSGTVKWSNATTGTSISINNVGTYSATCSNSCGESMPSNVIAISKGSNSTAPVITTSKNNICAGEEITLSATGCTNGTIIWTGLNQSGTSIKVIPFTTSTYSAICTQVCDSPAGSIVINVQNLGNLIVTGPKDAVCAGTEITLKASGCVGIVSWANGATGSEIKVIANESKTYSALCGNSNIPCDFKEGTVSFNKSGGSTGTGITTKYLLLSTNGNILQVQDSPAFNNVKSGNYLASAITYTSNVTGLTLGLNISNVIGSCVSRTEKQFSVCNTESLGCKSSGEISITVIKKPNAPTILSNKTIICGDEKSTLTASDCTGKIIWSTGTSGTIIQVSAGTYSATCSNACGVSEASNIIIIENGGTVNPPTISTNKTNLCGTETATLSATGCNGTVIWSNNATGTSISISDAGTYSAICKNSCGESSGSNFIVIQKGGNPAAPMISANKSTVCGDEKATLTAAGCTGAIVWSTGASGTNIQVSVGTYSATCSNACGVSGASNIVFIEKGGTVSPPTISTNRTNLCGTETAILTATGCAGTILWSNSLTGLSITVNMSGTYTAKCTGVGCGESGTSNQIVIKTGFAPSSPIISSSKIALCDTETAMLTASGCSDSIKWNTGASASSITVSNSGTYTAICANTCGESGNSNAIIISKTLLPASPSVTSDKTNLCGTETATLTASGCAGLITWSTSSTSTTITVSTVGTYIAICKNVCGESEPSQGIVINIGFSPAAPIISSDKMSVCKDEKATLMAMGCHGTITWSTGTTGTNLQVGAGTYTATCVNACGVSGSSNVVNIANGGTPSPPIIVADKTNICGTETATLTSSSCFGVITWNTGTTGSTLTVSSAGTYSVVCKNDCGTSLSSNIITIILGGSPTAPSITASQTQICKTETATLTISNCSGIITWNTGATGSSIVVSTIGTYSATCKNTCGTSEASIPVIITAKSDCGSVCNLSSPVITASKTEICKPENIILTATGCGSKIVWSNGATGTSITVKPFANTSYYAVCTDGNKCTSPLSNVINVKIGTITVPTVSCSTDLVCTGESVTLKAYNCEGTVVWSTGATGNMLTVSPTQNTSYTAYCKIGDCLSQETSPLSITVGLPNKPFIYCTKNTLCASESTTLTASGCSGIVEWSTGQTGAVITVSPITEKSVYSAVCRSTGGKCTSEKSNEITITVGKKVEAPKVITVLKNICPFISADLNNAILTEPSTTNGQFEFHVSSSPNSALVTNIGAVETGKYWVFERSTIGCYSDGIMIEVKTDTCNGGVTPPISKVDIAIRKTGSASVVPVGEILTYTVIVKNIGITKATGIIVRDILPNGLLLEQNFTNSTFSNGVITAKIDSLKSGDSTIFTYTTKVTALGKIINKAELFKIDQVDTVLSNNSSEFTINNPTSGDLIGLAKTLGDITKISDKVFDVPFTFNVVNFGGTDLSNIQVTDDLDRTFGNGVKILGDSIKVTADSGLVINPKFSARTSSINLLIDNKSTIKKGERKAIKFTVRVDMTNATTNKFFNSAEVTSGSLKDKSTDGLNPDPDGDGNPNNNDEPTPITISTGSSNTDSIGVGVALSVLDSNRTNSTCWNVTYMAIIKNTGKALLKNVRLTDSLKKCYGDSVDFKIVGKINLSKNSKLKVNPTFNGVDDVDILIADTTSQIGIGVQDTLMFTINICNGYVTKTYKNQVTVKAITAGNVVSDISNDGKIVDKNVDSPTYVTLTNQTGMMIPDGFSPNGDGKNDSFIIRLDNGSKLESCNIYNRWGELVFHDTESMNTLTTTGWDGTSNTGIRFGKEGLPDGTYYYAVKVAGETNMRIGFLTLAR